MSVFTKPNAIIYLRRNGLVIAGRRVTPARLNFPPELVDNLEILRHDKFIEGCRDFFVAHSIHSKRVLVVLDHSIVFSKEAVLDKPGKPTAIVKAFVDAMPFDAGKRACVTLQGPTTLKLFATNAELYQDLMEALRLSGASKLIAITPAAAYGLDEDHKQLSTAVEKFINDTKVRSQADFANITPL